MRRGTDLSINTIVVLAIAIIILISLVIFYTRNAGSLFGSISIFGELGANGTAQAASDAGSVLEGMR